ncbi:hypothetical protein CQA49_06830 [Helicobacter sp. MIT 00-7814]|uniref:hypothetical protein n=1 Tax=unclassified Helicobacter TaxID=2593540 RepID=UPI000E1F188F|nr:MULTISPECIES: hypothetical protein [unclassified Helicobacter]RDU53356.1 hypothetical protein CQA49_06830 [Helicobacter sp. MIT 00-7814]RDU54177.1 hypothetical protein CQA37_06070 [Helicobacter sp. MIT 99-10781]
MFNFIEINELCEKYFLTENGLNNLILMTAKRFYKGRKNIIFVDMEKQLFCYKKDDTFLYFKPRNKDINGFKKLLIKELDKHKKHIIKNNPSIARNAFFNKIGGKYIKAHIIEIADEMVIFSILKNGQKVGNYIINVEISEFFANDIVEIGHNFWLKIKDIEFGKSHFILSCTRKDNGVIKLEFMEVFNSMVRKFLSKNNAKNTFTKEDFQYKILGVYINKKEVNIEIWNKNIHKFVASVGGIFEKRSNFKLKWRVKNETK